MNTRTLCVWLVTLFVCAAGARGVAAAEEDSATTPAPRAGGWRLADASSVYVREHENDPIEWYPWGAEAFARAQDEDKLIYLSIGYASCHSCHRMHRLTFGDAEVARVLNEHFISIKVDREELPHVDRIYMDAARALRSGGGWPLSVFLTPALEPFAAAGRVLEPASFLEIAGEIARDWGGAREHIVALATHTRARLAALENETAEHDRPRRNFIDQGAVDLMVRFDETAGGFAAPPGFAPKFPAAREAVFLASLACLEGRPDLARTAAVSLERMAAGAIHDQVGGGFHRYATDREWSAPHFEKLLATQAMVAEACLEVSRLGAGMDAGGGSDAPDGGGAALTRIARRTLDAMLADFALEGGGFAASLDAESEGVEGRYYLWTHEQVTEAAGAQLAPLLVAHLGIELGGFGFAGDGRYLPRCVRPPEVLAQELEKPVAQIREWIDDGLARMRVARGTRVAPRRDPAVLLGWNALAVSALARAGMLLGDERYLNAATRTHGFVTRELAGDGGLLRRAQGAPAPLTDAALYLRACLDLYQATLAPEHVAQALRAARRIVDDYGPGEDGGAFYEEARGSELLGMRRHMCDEDMLPGGNATLAACFARLAALTNDERWGKLAADITADTMRRLKESAAMAPELCLTALRLESSPPLVILTGEMNHANLRPLITTAQRAPAPFVALAYRPSGTLGDEAARILGVLAAREAPAEPAASVCVRGACLPPEKTPARLGEAIRAASATYRDGKSEPADTTPPK